MGVCALCACVWHCGKGLRETAFRKKDLFELLVSEALAHGWLTMGWGLKRCRIPWWGGRDRAKLRISRPAGNRGVTGRVNLCPSRHAPSDGLPSTEALFSTAPLSPSSLFRFWVHWLMTLRILGQNPCHLAVAGKPHTDRASGLLHWFSLHPSIQSNDTQTYHQDREGAGKGARKP